MNGPVLVTGGTGFIGGYVLGRLARSGVTVRALVRNPDRLDPTVRASVEVVPGDLRDAESLRRAARGARAVIHLGACARAWSRDRYEFHAVNVEATRTLLAAALDHGVERFVHVSTILALPPYAPAPVNGTAAALTPYEATKMDGDRLVLDAAARGLNAVIVRPTRVFGPGPLNDANSVTRIVALYLAGRFRFRLDDGGVLGNYVHADDVAKGILLAARHGARGADYVLGGDNIAFRDLLDLIGALAGARRRVTAIPIRLALALGAAAELGGKIGLGVPLTRGWLRTFLEDRRADIAPARDALGYAPRRLADGIAETIGWLRRRAGSKAA